MFLTCNEMTNVLISKGFGDVEGERSEEGLTIPIGKEVMSWLGIIGDSNSGRTTGKLRADAWVSGR